MPHSIELLASTRKKTKESIRVDSLFPSELRETAVKLIDLLEDYYTHVNEDGQASYEINRVSVSRDIDETKAAYIDLIQKEIAAAIPRTLVADRVTLYKNLVRYYDIRGSDESIELFFKILFQDNAEVYFPRKDMLIASDGVWLGNAQVPRYAVAPTLMVYGNGSGARATLTVTGGVVTAVTVTNPGSGYTATATAEVFPTSAGSGAKIRPNITRSGVNAGKIESYEILNGGTGYTQSGTFLGYQNGYYNEKRGFLSDIIKLQDSYFYQKFSYVIKTGNNVETWKDVFSKLVHPAGMIFFGEILILIELLDSKAAMPRDQLGYIGPEDLAVIIVLQALNNLRASLAETTYQMLLNVPTGTDTSFQLKFFDDNPAATVYGAYNFSEMESSEYAWDDHSIADVINTPTTWHDTLLGVNYT